MYEASGQWSTTYSQPSALTDWWERRGEEGGEDGVGRRWSGGCILTIRRSILSSLNLPSFLPPLYPIYPFFLSYFYSSILFMSPPSSSPTFVSPAILPSPLLFPCLLPPASSAMCRSQVYPSCFWAWKPSERDKKKKDTCAPGEWAEGCALGQGAWPGLSRLSNPTVRGVARVVSQGRGVRRGDRRRGAGAVHRGDMPSKTNNHLYFFTQNIVCLSFPSPLCPPPLTSKVYWSVLSSPSHLPFFPVVRFSISLLVSINTLYIRARPPPRTPSTCPFWLCLSHHKPPLCPAVLIFSGR